MLKVFTVFVSAWLLSCVSATPDISSFLFRPNLNADQSLLEHAKQLTERTPTMQLQDTSVGVEIDLCDPETFDDLFKELAYRPEKYTRYKGLDHTALFASSVTLSDKYAVVGSNGYDVFKGIVHVYVPKTVSKWSLQALIRSPVWDNGNFGNDLDIDDERLVVAANAFDLYDGAVFVYERNLEHQCWLLHATIYSPLSTGPNRTIAQGFGYRVGMSGNFIIASTSINNAYIYKENNPGNWTLHTDLEPPEPRSFFGRAVAIENNLAVVGAYGFQRNIGRVFIYKYNDSADSWDHFDTLFAVRNHTNFGFSVDMQNGSIIVGANGFVEDQFENHEQFDSRLTQTVNNPGWAYIYQLSADGSHYELEQELESPVGNNSYFGAGVGIHGDKVIVGADGYPCHGLKGAAFVYMKQENGWTLNQSYPSPAGKEGHFGYAVDINSNVTAIGAYGFDELRGSIYLAEFPKYTYEALPSPTTVPTMQPSSPSEVLSGGSLTNEVGNTGLSLGLILALALGALILAATTGLIIYCCCCMVPIIPLVKKKKKKEEEDSPYTVHSYAGYVEEDEFMPMQAIAPPPVVLIEEDEVLKKKEKEKSVKFMEDGQLREMFPYKVYGPRGYVEEANNVDEGLLTKKKEEGDMADIYPQEEDENSDFEFDNSMPAGPPRANYRPARPPMQHENSYGSERMSLVDQARRSAHSFRTQDSQYSMYSDISHEQSSGKMSLEDFQHSLSSLSHSYPAASASSAGHSVSTLSEHRTSLGSDSRSYVDDDVDDDATAVSERSDLTSRGRASLVQQAKSKYQRQFAQEHMVTTTTTTTTRTVKHDENTASNYVGAALAKYASMSRSRDTQDQSDDKSVASTSLSGRIEPATSRSFAGTQDVSLVDRAKSRYLPTRTESGTISEGGFVQAAKERYNSLQGQPAAAADEDDDATVSSRTTLSSGRSAVDEARAKYARIRREQAASTVSMTEESSGPSFVENIQAKYRSMRDNNLGAESGSTLSQSLVSDARARYAAMSRSTDVDDSASVNTHSTGGSSSQSLVEAARAKYAAMKNRSDSRTGSSVVSSDEPTSTTGSSLVEDARQRYQRIKRGESTMSESSATQSVASSSQQSSSSYTGTGPGSEGAESSYVLAAKARYSSMQSSLSGSSYSSSSKYQSDTSSQQGPFPGMYQPSDSSVSSDHRTTAGSVYTRGSEQDRTVYSSSVAGIAAMSDDASSQSSETVNKVNVARQAAMSKFALYKAKAEEEAKLRAQEQDSALGVLIAERGSPLKKKAALAIAADATDDAVEETRMSAEMMEISEETESEESAQARRDREREETKLRAQAKAREKFARAKELAAETAPQSKATAEDEQMRTAMEEARAKLRRSAEAMAAEIPETPSVGLPSVSTTVKRSQTSSTTVSRSETTQHSVQSTSQTQKTVEVQRAASGKPPASPESEA